MRVGVVVYENAILRVRLFESKVISSK